MDCGFTFTEAQQWNKLPSYVENLTNIKEFKKHLKLIYTHKHL